MKVVIRLVVNVAPQDNTNARPLIIPHRCLLPKLCGNTGDSSTTSQFRVLDTFLKQTLLRALKQTEIRNRQGNEADMNKELSEALRKRRTITHNASLRFISICDYDDTQ